MSPSTLWLSKLFLAGACAVVGSAAIAHHSFAMFDRSKQVKVTGTVRAFEWTNPHTWLWVDTVNDKGETVTWGFEGAAPGEMARLRGWTKTTFTKGETVTVEASPLKDGRPGGSMGKVMRADGSSVGSANFGAEPSSYGPPKADAPKAEAK
mgnify:CR=1 FL=1